MDTPETWDGSCSVGNDLLDRQHKQLLAICSRVAGMLGSSGFETAERFHEALHELAEYTRTHFDVEEAILKRCGYPGLDAHIAEHSDCLRRLTDFLVAASHGVIATDELHHFLSNWWTQHVRVSDARYASYIRAPA